MEGWIKLHRQITEHWIWRDPIKFQWWVDVLLSVNHEDVKVNIGYEIYECKRGQSIMSLQSWGKRWGVSKETARHFLNLLEKDNMIVRESISKSTRITVCNYDTYQCSAHDSLTMARQSLDDGLTQAHPNKNDKNDNNEKNNKESTNVDKKNAALAATLTRKDGFYKSLVPFVDKYPKDMIRAFFDYWSEMNKSETKMRFEKQPTWEVGKRLATWANKETFNGKSNSKAKSNFSSSDRRESVEKLSQLADGVLQGIASEKFS